MDLTALMSTMLSEESIAQMGQKAGASTDDVKSVLLSALPAMLSGLQNQADGADTVAGFAGALDSHAQVDTSDITAFLSGVDLEDGNKIVGHLLGAEQKATTKAAAKKAGISAASSGNILSTAAPLLMSHIGQQATQEVQSQPQSQGFLSLGGSQQQSAASASGGGLLSSLLGGGQQQQQQAASSSGGGLLGALLGGGQQQQQQSSSAGLLGALLGGGAQQQQQASSGGNNLLGSMLGSMLGNVDITSLLFSMLGSN